MFSYRHAFHAGNHADVLKHVVLLALVRHLQRKDGACWFVDTHAGGIGAFWAEDPGELPQALGDYLARVHDFNPDGRLLRYPGSPALLGATLRAQDRLRLYELHPTEIDVLRGRFPQSRRIRVERA